MGTEYTVYDYTLYVPSTTNISITVAGKHSYSSTSGSQPWQLNIYFDGTLINYAGGATAYTDSPVCIAAATGVTPGNHEVKIGWYGSTAITLRGCNCIIDANYK